VWGMYESMLEKYVQIRTNRSKISKFFSACRDAQELGTNSNTGSDDGYLLDRTLGSLAPVFPHSILSVLIYIRRSKALLFLS
jgi:hypothetical protein